MKKYSEEIYVYHIVNGSHGYEKVEGLGVFGDKVYYYPPDFMLMTYDTPVNRFEIKDQAIKKHLSAIINLDTLSDPINKYCRGITKNEFIVRIKSSLNNEILKEFVIIEFIECDEKSEYSCVSFLSKFFKEKKE